MHEGYIDKRHRVNLKDFTVVARRQMKETMIAQQSLKSGPMLWGQAGRHGGPVKASLRTWILAPLRINQFGNPHQNP